MNSRSLSLTLRRIAATLDNSKNPSRELVARDLKNLVNKIAKTDEEWEAQDAAIERAMNRQRNREWDECLKYYLISDNSYSLDNKVWVCANSEEDAVREARTVLGDHVIVEKVQTHEPTGDGIELLKMH